ncbi:glycosyltransferase family 4 protein [Gemmatimonas sp.]|uniref:glycosyltransferase family 4 protein n=1 Tax=Gemmatimonas sp. TaxID=1962908 RepID=UPI0022C4244A|nr:glycosyltransferase family 4 protein [Gemmatimonas sp.]MCZ8204287.1 glycosyltransferase family 4 protein [Gemmatimonas sp.]
MIRHALPRLLFVGAHPRSAGSNIAASRELAQQLAQQEWTVDVVSSRATGVGRLVEQLAAAVRARRGATIVVLDVFGGRAFHWAHLVGKVCAARGIPYVAYLHGGGLPQIAERVPGALGALLQQARATVSPSTWLARTVASRWVAPQVIPNGIELSRYRWRQRAQTGAHMLWVRALHPIYRPELAVQVVQLLHAQGIPATLTMVGPDKHGMHGTLTALIAKLGLARHIHLVGAVGKAEIPGWMDKADLLLNTTDVDNAPVSLVEAMACGLPVVTTNAGGIPDLLATYHGPAPVPCGSAEALAGAVALLLQQPDAVAAASVSGREIAQAYDWPMVHARWSTLLREIAAPSA